MSAALVPTGRRVGARALLAAVSLALSAGGIALMAQGALVPIEAKVAQVRLEQSFDQALARHVQARVRRKPAQVAAPALLAEPSDPAPGQPLARITVKRLGVRDVVLAGPATHDELARGPMMVKRGDAASPVTVIAAHRDTHFLFVRDLREGDLVTLQYVTGEVQRYRVTWFETVRWNAFAYPLDPPRPLLALTTCYPFGGTEYGGPWRRVAWAEAVE